MDIQYRTYVIHVLRYVVSINGSLVLCGLYRKEFKNDNYLLLFLFPVPRGTVYVAKLIYLISMTFLSVLIAYVAFMLSGFILGVCLPSMGFQNFDVRILVISVFFRVLLGYCLSLLFNMCLVSCLKIML